MRRAIIVFSVVGLFSPSPYAADAQVDKAVSAYDDFEYQKAIVFLQQALSGKLSAEDRIKARIYLGLSYFTLGNQKEAEEAFRKALSENYDVQLPPDTSPKITEFFQKIKASMPPPKRDPAKGVQDGIGGVSGVGIIEKKPPPPPQKRVWTWVALGAGGALTAGGAVFAYLASSAKSDFDKEPWADRAARLKSTVENRALAANILLGTGGAALVASLVLFFVEGRPAAEPKPVSVNFGPTGLDFLVRF